MKSSNEILNRTFILLILADRGLLEKEFHEDERYTEKQREEQKDKIVKIVNERGIINDFSNKEKQILSAKIGSLDENTFNSTQLQYEAIQTLLWSLNIIDFPKYDGKFCSIDFHNYIGKYGTKEFNLDVDLREIDDIKIMNEIAMLWHWRAREGTNNNYFNEINLKIEIPKLFGAEYKEHLMKIPLSEKKPVDFLVDKKLFNSITKELYDTIIIQTEWIHHALEWIINDDNWEDTDTST